MGFNKVNRSLQEIFPQIDARVLRAVAIEHSKDADAAVEAVLVEIIPFFTEKSIPNTPLAGSIYEAPVGDVVATTETMDRPSVNAVGSADGQNGHNMNGGNLEGENSTVGPASSREILESNVETKTDAPSHGENTESVDRDGVSTLRFEEVSGDTETYRTISDVKSPESTIEISSSTLQDENIAASKNMSTIHDKVDCAHLETTIETVTLNDSGLEKSWADGQLSVAGPSSLTAHDLETSPLEDSVKSVALQDMRGSDLEDLDKSSSSKTDSKMETTSNASMSRSSQINITEALEGIIADARNNKITLLSGMESVISLMKEVELKEQAAEQAKVEAAMDGTDILARLEECKLRAQHEMEWNSMHAGEVYGEKAILATELRELQSRVLSVSDERDKSLKVLDEMRQTLEMRLAAAENEIKSAEQEKFEKREAAMKSLDEQELIFKKMLQESKILKQQAEENVKLQEFLVDRGRVVDMLQGEISVICHDVKMLKESFDENVPFTKSISSSQTSCIVASSTKNPNPEDSVPDVADSLVGQLERDGNPISSQWELTMDDLKDMMDGGWEFFDDMLD